MFNLSFEHLIVDEFTYVKKTTNSSFQALNAICRKSTFLLSDTFLANHWSDSFAALALLQGIPIKNISVFYEVFGSTVKVSANPPASRISRLQKCL